MSAKNHRSTNHSSPPQRRVEDTGHGPHLTFSRPGLIILGLLLIAPWALVARLLVPGMSHAQAASKTGASNEVITGESGPWGTLKYTRLDIAPPSDFLSVDNPNLGTPRWFFGHYTREQLTGFFKSSGLTDTQLTSVLQQDKWTVSTDGITVTPGDDLIMGMSQDARGKIYRLLDDFPQNEAQRVPYSFRPEFVDSQLADSGLSKQSKDLLKSMLYQSGSSLLFADLPTVLPRIADHDEKLRFFKTLTRRLTLLAKLKVTPDSDIDALVKYWGYDGRAKDLRPLFESLARVPGGCTIDIAHLLPPLPRQLIYTYPYPSTDATVSHRDCHWTSLNFFNKTADDRFTDPAYVKKVLETQYHPIDDAPRLGDEVVLTDSNGTMIHSAAYLADNIVFTKNGAIFTQPWMYMKLDDLQIYYQTFYPPDQAVKTMIFRRNGDHPAG